MGRNARNTIIEVSDADSCVMDLNEGNVQAIFERCLAKKDSKERTGGILFSTMMGFSEEDEKLIEFDKDSLLADKLKIEYLFGQLKVVHDKVNAAPMADFVFLYNGDFWTKDSGKLLRLLYLDVTAEIDSIDPVFAETRKTVLNDKLKPTLSPKDPAFPTWWEQHKAEWED